MKKYSKRFIELLLVIAIAFSPYTSLRIGVMGISELSFLFLIIYIFLLALKGNFKIKSHTFSNFWVFFLVITIFGFFYNYLFLDFTSGSISTFIFDLSAYLFIFICLFFLELYLNNNPKFDYKNTFMKIYLVTSSLISILFIISRFKASFLGLSLLHYNFFRPIADNVHQISMIILPMLFIGLLIFRDFKSKRKKLFILVIQVLLFLSLLATGSFKALLSLPFALVLISCSLIIRRAYYKKKTNHLLIFSLLVISIAVIMFEPLMSFGIALFRENDISSGREILWTSSFNKILESPYVGYGPGAHAELFRDYFSDAHQTLLTIGLQAGFLGIIAFLSLHIKIIKKIIFHPIAFGVYSSTLVYLLGGDIMRKLSFWVLYLLIFNYVRFRGERDEK